MTFPYKNNKALILKTNSLLTCMMKVKSALPNIRPPAIMDECEVVDEFPYNTSQVVMDDCVNDKNRDSIIKDFVEKMKQKFMNE